MQAAWEVRMKVAKEKKCDIYTAPFNKKNLEKFPFIPHKMTKFACQETEES